VFAILRRARETVGRGDHRGADLELVDAIALLAAELGDVSATARTGHACPRCLRVVDGLRLVTYSVALEVVGPVWVCDECLLELYRSEDSPPPSTIGGYIWGVVLENADAKGAPLDLDELLARRTAQRADLAR
jgi:hypothetical protein